MMHSILPPHLVEHLAQHTPAFRRHLMTDASIRAVRGLAVGDAATEEVAVYDAKNQMNLPGEKVEGEGPEEAVRVRQHADNIKGLMGKGKPLPQTSIPDLIVNYGKIYPNAFFDGMYLVFGEGDGEIFGDFSKPLDVAAHEFGHKIIDAGPKLEYAGQPGALNESIADVIGVCVKKHAGSAQVADGDKTGADDWRIGAELFLEPGPALRDMANPGTAYDNELLGKDPQVGHMKDYVETFMDNGGVHTNSGIPNKAFVEAATRIGGNPWETPLEVWLKAMAKASAGTNFEAFAQLTVEVAGEFGEKAAAAVAEGWQAVGLLGKDDCPETPAPLPEPVPEPAPASS